jgi:hypothetical protein
MKALVAVLFNFFSKCFDHIPGQFFKGKLKQSGPDETVGYVCPVMLSDAFY